jgi:TM2 domain-containing membrane protein YozV
MKLSEKLWQVSWHLVFTVLAAIGLALWILGLLFSVFMNVFLVVLYLTAVAGGVGILLLVSEAVKSLKQQQDKIAQIGDILSENKNLLQQISRDVRLSEAARTIAYRDADRQQLRISRMEKLHQQDFETTYAMIEDIGRRNEYKQLAAELKLTADNYRNATDIERVNQVISYIDKLLAQYQWTAASVQIERLLTLYPGSEQAKAMPARLAEEKEQRKRELLAAWDAAVKKADTDYSLQILKELDLYLTPSEGLALQEAASEIFRNKLHNLGVQFALVVSEKNWDKALETGREIIKDFPNSRMADEIRSKLAILKELAKK